jgi:hypothetical protein
MVDLERELAAAAALARDQRVVAAINGLNLRVDAVPWGVHFAAFAGRTYAPDLDADPAFIFAAEANGDLVDLVACRLADRVMASRLGIADVLGEDWIAVAREAGDALPVFADALGWANGGFIGTVILDWSRAPTILMDVKTIRCASRKLAAKAHAALTRPTQQLTYVRPRPVAA